MTINNTPSDISPTSQRRSDNRRLNPESLDWEKMGWVDSNYASHIFELVSPSRMELKTSARHKLFALLFMVGGIFTVLMTWFGRQESSTFEILVFFVMSIAFIAIGAWLWVSKENGVFDKKLGWFWFGSTKIEDMSDIQSLEKKCRLANVIGVQFIENEKDSIETSYKCYELNLLLKNGDRFHVLRQGGDKFKMDAKLLAKFLKVEYYEARYEGVVSGKSKLIIK